MSKRDNKRFNDKERKSAPKRGGKNRRDYGDSYEPKSRAAGSSRGGSRRQGAAPVKAGARGGRPRRDEAGARGTAEKARRSLLEDFGFGSFDEEDRVNIGNDGLEVVAGRNPVVEVLSGDRDVERRYGV